MPRQALLESLLKEGSRDFREANPDVGDSGQAAVMERTARHGALGKGQVEAANAGRVLVRVTSFRHRLLDEDNLCEKYVVDCCRYAGLIRSDAPGAAKIEVAQQKVGKGEEEFVRVEIFEI